MKILKIFGIVVGIHVFALILIFANPGCSSTTKPPPQPADTLAQAESAPMITVPNAAGPAPSTADSGYVSPAPVGFNPDAPATYADSGPGVRFTPIRPNTPAASAVQAQPVENVTPVTTYVVKHGDSLWTLQKKFHVNFKEIAAANNMKTSTPLREGQKLIIPRPAPSSASKAAATHSSAPTPVAHAGSSRSESAPAAKVSGEVTYTVRPGDTIEGIAKRFEVKPKDLALHNNIANPLLLRAGTVLSIPGWRSTGSSRAAAATPEPMPKVTQQPPVESKPAAPAMIDIDQPQPSPANNVPVIRIDDNPITPAPVPKQ